jgi:hypothetical protein
MKSKRSYCFLVSIFVVPFMIDLPPQDERRLPPRAGCRLLAMSDIEIHRGCRTKLKRVASVLVWFSGSVNRLFRPAAGTEKELDWPRGAG